MEPHTSQIQLVSEKEAAQFLGFTIRFMQSRRIKGNVPRFVKVSSRAIRYQVKDRQEWIDRRLKNNTSEQ